MISIILALLQVFSLWGLGYFVNLRLRFNYNSIFENVIVAFACILIFEYVLNYFGLIFLIKYPKIISSYFIFILGIINFINILSKRKIECQEYSFVFDKTKIIFLISIVLFLSISILLTMLITRSATPCREGDALTGYFFSSKWISEYGFRLNPYNLKYWHFPLGIESIYSVSFNLGYPNAAKVLEVLIFLAFILELKRYIFGCFQYLITIAIIITLPDVINIIGSGKIDIISTSFFAYLLIKMTKPINFNDMFLYACLFFILILSKYTFWILLFVPGLYVVCYSYKNSQKLIIFISVIFLAFFLVTFKNYITTSNPIAPFCQKNIPTNNVYFENISDHIELRLSNFSNYILSPKELGLSYLFLFFLILGIFDFILKFKHKESIINSIFLPFLIIFFWLVIRGHEWYVTRFFLGCLILISYISVNNFFISFRNIYITSTIGIIAIFTIGVSIKQKAYWYRDYSYLIGVTNEYKWQKLNGIGRGYTELRDLKINFDSNRKILIGTSFFNIESKFLKYVSTEAEYFSFLNTNNKYDFCKKNKFKYVYLTKKNALMDLNFKLLYHSNKNQLPVYIYSIY